MKHSNVRSLLARVSLLLIASAAAHGQSLTVREIMAEPSIAGMRAEGEKLSPDGTKVIYLWNAEGKQPRNLYLVSTSGGDAVKILSPSDLPPPSRAPEKENKLDYGLVLRDDFVKERENQFGNFEWSPDSKRLVTSYGGDLYVITIGEAKPRRLTKTQTPESGARFLDNDRILFLQSGNLFVWDLTTSLLTQVSKEANAANFISVFNAIPNKPGSLIAYVVSDSSKNKALLVPNYLDEFVVANPTRRGWTDQKVLVAPADGSRDTPFEVKLPKPEGVSNIRRMVWAADNSSLIIDRVDQDTKRRQLFYVYNVGSKGEKIIPVIEETDDKWQAPLSSIFEPNPRDPSELFFGSEKDGFNHLYLAKLEAETRSVGSVPSNGERVAEGPPGFTGKVATTQLTNGHWQVEWAKWTNKNEIAFASTQGSGIAPPLYPGYAERQLSLYRSDQKDVVRLQPGHGMRANFQISETANPPLILFEGSAWNHPGELYVQKASLANSSPQEISRLTHTVPVSFPARKWSEPRFLEINSRDGKKIPAKIYLPERFNQGTKQKYPMVVFVHGAGYLQNVINGWNNYYREFMFNQLLTQKGYVVLDIDYRGSAGYSRDWRTDVYDFLGGKDFDDHIDSIDYMVKSYNVNPAKVGVYGGSYGGFMAAMLAERAPDKIAAAAALRPVFDWKNYYASSPGYTAQRLGFPDKNPEAYKRSSPITYADKLERPLLILHGMSDDNVHVQDSVQMMEKLIRLGKTQYFETMLYPSENHGFARPESWTDEYERILAFFEKNLK
ncbi:MAG TPA: alpha/beta fold hydrolase [Pyrinomonadaceae bacterium]|nr:alpha/beta fold hydrolase [Pyrinomonadaceae bacterium]